MDIQDEINAIRCTETNHFNCQYCRYRNQCDREEELLEKERRSR